MNHRPRHFLVALLTLGTLAHAQDSSAGDPFVKGASGISGKKDEPWQNVLAVLEVYVLDKIDAAGLTEAEPASGARYRRVLDLEKANKARLQSLTALTGRSGRRNTTSSLDDVRYPGTFDEPNLKTGFVPPTTWETREVGDTFDFEPVISPDRHTCDLNLVPEQVRFLGFQDLAGMGTDGAVARPRFDRQKITTSINVAENEPYYLGTFSPPSALGIANGGGPSETRLAFLHLFLPGPTADELKAPAKPEPIGSVNLEYRWYSLERVQARDLLLSASAFHAPWEKLQALLQENKARLEHLTTLTTKAGQRAVVEETEEFPYSSQYLPEVWGPRAEAKKQPARTPAGSADNARATPAPEPVKLDPVASPAQRHPGYIHDSETRNLGATVEVEPVITKDGLCAELNQAVQSITFPGNLQISGIAARYPAQPVFETRKITSSQFILFGKPTFVGTFNPPGADGVNDRPDTGRTWLLFIRARGER